jgi:hypothetical protein
VGSCIREMPGLLRVVRALPGVSRGAPQRVGVDRVSSSTGNSRLPSVGGVRPGFVLPARSVERSGCIPAEPYPLNVFLRSKPGARGGGQRLALAVSRFIEECARSAALKASCGVAFRNPSDIEPASSTRYFASCSLSVRKRRVRGLAFMQIG